MTTVDHRAALIADLRAFADLLEARPDLPVGEFDDLRFQHSITHGFGDENARIAEVHRVADVLGVDVQRNGQTVRAELDLGRKVTYVVHANTDYGKAVFDAEQTYWGAIEPDLVGAS